MSASAPHPGWLRRAKPIAAALLASQLAAGASSAQEPAPSPPATPPAGLPATPPGEHLLEVTVTAPEPRYVAPTRRDRIGRIWAPVLLNGQGPFRLVLDTGSSASALTQRLVDALGLPVRTSSLRLRGATGTAVVSSVRIDQVEVGDLLLRDTTMPIVADVFGGAEGVLGTESLGDKRIVIEFLADRITIVRSHRQPAPPGYTTVPFTFSRTHGLRVDVQVGSVRAVALIDTGAAATVGNLALREALSRRQSSAADPGNEIVGVTGDIQQAEAILVPTIYAGDLLVRNATISFSDLFIFDYWKLTSKPAVLIGMDVLGALDTLIIDYRRRELQIRTPRSGPG
jgi:predicted aspartyl protease